MNSNTFTDKAKAIIKKPWREVTKDDLEYLMRHGYSFDCAINELVEDGKMTL